MLKKCLCSLITPNFIPGYVGFVKSLLQVHPDFSLDFVLLEIGMTEKDREFCRQYYPKLTFIQPNYKMYEGTNFEITVPHLRNTYYKLDIFSLYKLGYQQAIFIDLDVIVLDRISLLFRDHTEFLAVRSYREACDRLVSTFNSGVFVIGKQWLNEKTYHALVEDIKQGYKLPDQECLNKYFREKTQILPKEYNVEKRMYKSDKFKKTVDKAKILHYVAIKPWQDPITRRDYRDKVDFAKLEEKWWNIMNRISIRKAKNAISGLEDLCDYISRVKPIEKVTMVEIGSFAGNSSEVFAKRVKHLTCVDPWQSNYSNYDGASDPSKYNMVEVEKQFDIFVLSQYPNVTKIKTKSQEAVKDFKEGSLDFVYIDGNHAEEFVEQDIKMWLPKVKRGGFIGGHDYLSKHHPGVRKAVDRNIKVEATFKDTSWIARKL